MKRRPKRMKKIETLPVTHYNKLSIVDMGLFRRQYRLMGCCEGAVDLLMIRIRNTFK